MTRVVSADDIADDELADLYEYPEFENSWVRANFVVSIDGAVTTNGSSGGLTTPLDQRILKLLRDLADVVLVGASTIRVEDYIGIRTSEAGRQRRVMRGLSTVAPLAVVSGRADIDPDSRLLTNTSVPPIILTSTDAPATAKRNLAAAGAEVIELGPNPIDVGAIIESLQSLGLRRILCEGGPTLTGQLAAGQVLDEICVTTVPKMVCGTAHRITHSDRHANLGMRCNHLILDDDGTQFARWTRESS